MEYLLKTSAVVIIFYACYKLFLQRDTFFESNRVFLLFGIIIAFITPYIVIPIYIEKAPLPLNEYVFDNIIVSNENIKEPISFLQVATIIYFSGIVIFLLRFIIQLTSLFLIISKNKKEQIGRFTYVKVTDNTTPFSFFNWIVYSSNQFNDKELKQIIMHEQIHAYQYHSIDILLTQLACIILWFNPFIWLYNKDLKQNLEFIADQNAQHKSDCKKSYQYALLKTSMPIHQLALTNNFYNSLIKKRIVMLHKSKSKKVNLLKYILVIPVLVIFLMSFNTKEIFIETEAPLSEKPFIDVIPQEEEQNTNVNFNTEKDKTQKKLTTKKLVSQSNIQKEKDHLEAILITKDFKNIDLEKIQDKLKKNDISIKFKSIKRNNNGEIIAIKIDIKSKQSNANYNINSDEAIKPIKISFDDNGKNISIGNGHKSYKDKDTSYIFKVKDKDGNHKIHKTGKGNNVFVISENNKNDDENIEVIIENDQDSDKDGNKFYKLKSIGKGKNNTVTIKSTDDNDPIIILDGEEVKLESLNTNEIESINVFKGKAATEKYGIKGKNGIIEVTPKEQEDAHQKIKIRKIDGKNPLYIIDGKESTAKKLEKLDPDKIKTINVLKDDAASKKYGDKGKNGVIEISTKKSKTLNNNSNTKIAFTVSGKVTNNEGKSLPGIKITNKNSGYTTATDFGGNYTIKVTKGDKIVYSFVGMNTKEITIKNKENVNVTLKKKD